MSKYFQPLHDTNPRAVSAPRTEITHTDAKAREMAQHALSDPASRLCRDLARDLRVHRLAEQLAPLAVVNGPVRVLVTGCRPGDGASTIAGALALDLSQRLRLNTLLIEARPNHHTHRLQPPRAARGTNDPWPDAHIGLLQPSERQHLETLAYALQPDAYAAENLDNLAVVIARYQAAVMDLGVVRLEARVLNMIKPGDPVLIVARHAQTEHQELLNTVNALRATNRMIAGVILNDYKSQLPRFFRWLLGNGG